MKSAGIAIEGEFGGCVRPVRIISTEANLVPGFPDVEKQERVIYGELRETNHMHHRRMVVVDFLGQVFGGLGLVMSRERLDHAPVSALKVTLPRSAAVLFEQGFVGTAEFMKIREAWDDNSMAFVEGASGAETDDLLNQPGVGGCVRHGQLGREAGVFEELSRGASDHEAMMGVIRRRFPGLTDPPFLFVEMVFPNQFIGVGKGVLLEIEGAWIGSNFAGRERAASQHNQEQQT